MASFKEQRLSEINSLIKQVETYQKIPPQNNPFIQNRLAYLDENPCTTGLYYVNAYLKPGAATSQPNVLQRYIQTIQVQIPLISIISAATNNNFKISANITYPNSGVQIISASQLSYCSTVVLDSLPRIFKDNGNYEDMNDNEKIYEYQRLEMGR